MSDVVETVGWVLQRHRLAARGVGLVALMLAAAAGLNAVWHTVLGNVIAALLIVFAGVLTFLMLLVGVSMGLHRLRHGSPG